jgi:serine/threonine protein kinase
LADFEEVDAFDHGPAALPVGTVLRGKYRIDGVLGTGGMGVVYAATHRNRKRFAVKMLHAELSTRRDVRSRFIREGYIANSVEHPGVVAVLDDDVTEDGSAFLVMELLKGATVDGFSPRSKPLPVRESLAIAHEVLDVLDAAHAKNIVHRDIKPANIFVTRNGDIKVLDFGIARLRDATLAGKATGTGAMLGTPAFMAPEQALALASEIDARTDLWAVGATLFTMLSGCLVHLGDNARQVLVRAATEPARSLASLAPDLPEALVACVTKALMFDKAERWQSARAMRDALAQAQRDLYGAFEVGGAKRLFELRALDLETAPTELSPVDALSSAVRETTKTTLDSFLGKVGDPHSVIPAPPAEVAKPRRLGAVHVVGMIALGLGLVLGSQHFSRSPMPPAVPVHTVSTTATVPPPNAERAPAAAPPPEHELEPAPTISRAAPAQLDTKRNRVSPPPAPTRPQSPAVPATASAPVPSAHNAPPPAPVHSPLQLDIQ